VSGVWLCSVMLAQVIKWPPAVLYFKNLLVADEFTGTARQFVDALRATVRHCDNQKWPEMFRRAGRLARYPGPRRNYVFCFVRGVSPRVS
jgi:hypothetical protein